MSDINKKKCSSTKHPSVVVFDVDGVMTTGQFLYSKQGKEYKVFGAHDNDGIKIIKSMIKIVFVTADKRGFPISKKRIVDDMHQQLNLVGEHERFEFIEQKYGLRNVIYMGDGIHDVNILRSCYYGITPNNARAEAKQVADYITSSNSGEGAVLDACLHIKERFFNSKIH